MPTSTKSSLIEQLRDEKERWEALLRTLSESEITAPALSDGWAIKDVMAHLMAWQQRSNARLEAALSGQAPLFPDWPTTLDPEIAEQPNELNAWIYNTYHDQPWSRTYHMWRDGFQKLIDQSEQIPEADLFAPGHYSWLKNHPLSAVLAGTLEHHNEHYEWLQQRAP
jgi:hypothetical protein